jgi:hypothetical protein
MYLLQEYQVKRKKAISLLRRFPSLEALDRMNYTLLVWGLPLMTLGIITGSMWAAVHWGQYWSWSRARYRRASRGYFMPFYCTVGLRSRCVARRRRC